MLDRGLEDKIDIIIPKTDLEKTLDAEKADMTVT